jgi:hypothetical protein
MNLSTADLRNYRTEFHELGGVIDIRKERIRIIIIIIIIKIKIKIKIIIRNGAKTISPPNFVWETF